MFSGSLYIKCLIQKMMMPLIKQAVPLEDLGMGSQIKMIFFLKVS